MKKIILLFCPIFIICCNRQSNYVPDIVGTYSMISQTINNGNRDSSVSRKQLKIFTDKYVMFASNTISDSTAVYGIGTYRAERGKVIENIFYTSTYGDRKDTFELKIDTTASGYKQVIDRITMSGKTYKLTEEYKKIGTSVNTPLNGAWKKVKNIYIHAKGDSSVN